MKICQTCNTQNDDTMSFCLQCGAVLPAQIRVNFNDQNTPSMPGGPSTNFGQSQKTQNFDSNFQQAQPPRKKNNTKVFLAIGGIGLLFLLFVGAGAAIIGYNILTKPKPTPYPTVIPTKTTTPIFSPTGTPTFTPTVVPSIAPSVAPSVAPTTNSGAKPTAKFTKMSVDYNVYENNQYGMRIHTTFTTSNLKGVDSYLLISFLKKDGSKLFTNNTTYKGQNGEVVVAKALRPNFDETEFKDLQVFMPYKELNLTPGKYNLQMDIDVIYPNYDLIQHLNLYDFQYEEFAK